LILKMQMCWRRKFLWLRYGFLSVTIFNALAVATVVKSMFHFLSECLIFCSVFSPYEFWFCSYV
jgi:hypothetical protein